jgi:outer membrane protein OmpA-like peptidoglycan-associated protein
MLNEVVTILKEYSDYSLRMMGHTDNSGNSESNLILSQARVDEVRMYLISKGIAESRLEAIGFGAQRPITTNDTPAGRTENRRVEMELYLK